MFKSALKIISVKCYGNYTFNLHKRSITGVLNNRRFLQSCKITSNLKSYVNNLIKTKQNSRDYYLSTRYFGTKIFLETENAYAYNYIKSNPAFSNTLAKRKDSISSSLTESEFRSIVDKNWRLEPLESVVDAFKTVSEYAHINRMPISNIVFDNLVNGLLDKCEHLTDEQLSGVMLSLVNFAPSNGVDSHNFYEVWSALDDVCKWKLNSWNTEQVLYFSDHWFQLNLVRLSDFMYYVLRRISRNPKALSKDQLVQALFYVNSRRKMQEMFEFDYYIGIILDEFTLEDLAIVAMAFFKTQTPIKGPFILAHIINRLIENISTVPEIPMSSLLKIIRYSPHLTLIDQIEVLLQKLIPEIPRLSIQTCLHIALLGTQALVFNPQILKLISEKYIANIRSARLKDLERLTFALTLFNYDPKTEPCIYESIINELHNPERQSEIERYSECLPRCVYYLCLRHIHPHDLIDRVLDMNVLRDVYGSNRKTIDRSYHALDRSMEIECPDYSGNRLEWKLKSQMTRWHAEFIPHENQPKKLTSAEKMMLEIMNNVKNIYGENNVHVGFVLPHFERADIIICLDKSGKPVEMPVFQKYDAPDIKRPEPTKNLTWIAIVVGGWNSYIRNTLEPLGATVLKMDQLKMIGYTPLLIKWCEFQLLSQNDKVNYIKDRVSTILQNSK